MNSTSTLSQLQQQQRKRFSAEEDEKLRSLVQKYGSKKWEKIAKEMPGRTGRQCRGRYQNYLIPGFFSGQWTPEEDDLLIKMFHSYGPQWTKMAVFFPGRSPGSIKNRWNFFISKHLPDSQLNSPIQPEEQLQTCPMPQRSLSALFFSPQQQATSTITSSNSQNIESQMLSRTSVEVQTDSFSNNEFVGSLSSTNNQKIGNTTLGINNYADYCSSPSGSDSSSYTSDKENSAENDNFGSGFEYFELDMEEVNVWNENLFSFDGEASEFAF